MTRRKSAKSKPTRFGGPVILHRTEPAPSQDGGRAVFGQGEAAGPDRKKSRKMDTQEEKLRQLKDGFKYETDEEIKRKREVYRSHIVRETPEEIAESQKDLEFNRKAYEVPNTGT